MGKRYRLAQINELLRQEIGKILMERVRDPRIGMVTVTGVRTSADLHHAKVFVSVLNEQEDLEGSIEGLNHASGFVRKLLGDRIKIRYTPELQFIYDDSTVRGDRIMRTLKDLREAGELEPPEEAEQEKSE